MQKQNCFASSAPREGSFVVVDQPLNDSNQRVFHEQLITDYLELCKQFNITPCKAGQNVEQLYLSPVSCLVSEQYCAQGIIQSKNFVMSFMSLQMMDGCGAPFFVLLSGVLTICCICASASFDRRFILGLLHGVLGEMDDKICLVRGSRHCTSHCIPYVCQKHPRSQTSVSFVILRLSKGCIRNFSEIGTGRLNDVNTLVSKILMSINFHSSVYISSK